MTPANRIRAAVSAIWDASPVTPTADDLAAAVCEALADVVETPSQSTEWGEGFVEGALALKHGILSIAAELRGEVRNG